MSVTTQTPSFSSPIEKPEFFKIRSVAKEPVAQRRREFDVLADTRLTTINTQDFRPRWWSGADAT